MHASRQRTSDKGGGSREADKRGEGEGGVNRELLNAIAARDAATLAQRRTLQLDINYNNYSPDGTGRAGRICF